MRRPECHIAMQQVSLCCFSSTSHIATSISSETCEGWFGRDSKPPLQSSTVRQLWQQSQDEICYDPTSVSQQQYFHYLCAAGGSEHAHYGSLWEPFLVHQQQQQQQQQGYRNTRITHPVCYFSSVRGHHSNYEMPLALNLDTADTRLYSNSTALEMYDYSQCYPTTAEECFRYSSLLDARVSLL